MEIIKQLNRIQGSDLSLTARDTFRDAILHINDLYAAVQPIRELYFKLRDSKWTQKVNNQEGLSESADIDQLTSSYNAVSLYLLRIGNGLPRSPLVECLRGFLPFRCQLINVMTLKLSMVMAE